MKKIIAGIALAAALVAIPVGGSLLATDQPTLGVSTGTQVATDQPTLGPTSTTATV